MYIEKAEIKNFRNYSGETVELSPFVNVFCGENAQGKTNFIEAVYVAAMGKSFKTVPEQNLIKFGEKQAEINVEFFGYNNSKNKLSAEIGSRKILKFNGLTCEKRSEYIGNLNVILFTPQEISVVRGAPSERRRFIDSCCGLLDKKYVFALYNYTKIVENKNRLLKSIQENPSLSSTLFVWNEKLCEYGTQIIKKRFETVEALKEKSVLIYEKLSGGREMLNFSYISCGGEKNFTEKEIYENLMSQIEHKQEEEIKEGCCLTGPHRDDIYFYIDKKKVKDFGSQGQQRSVVLALKLAQMQLFYDKLGEYPVLLLDDVKSELDLSRRSYLYSEIKDKQVIITCTDAETLFEHENAAFFEVKDGRIKKLDKRK